LSYAAKHASLAASDRVGWAWHVLAISSAEAPYSAANTNSEIISPAFGPIICTPIILSVSLATNTFTNPAVSSLHLALELAMNGNFPFLYSIFLAFNYSSVYPIDAISGWV